ncbi:TPA: hypothetical protein NJ298_004070 [Vibrio parahaemolyticus]|nr:hypothetical protein [Vibrio parahaemolyticus]HCH0358242.1 hypothetical protein [Vibrio parahaemolyticus]
MKFKVQPLYTIPSLSELDKKTQEHTPLNPVSEFVRAELRKKIEKKPELERLEERIIEALSKHKDVIKRDKQKEALAEFEKKYFKTLLERIIGGCSSPNTHIIAIEEAKDFISSLFKTEKFAHLRLGFIISFLKNHYSGRFNMVSLSHNTLRKVMKEIAPKTASRRGRGNPKDLCLLKSYLLERYGIHPQGV